MQQARQIDRDAAAAEDHHILHGPPVLAERREEAAQLAAAARDGQQIAGFQDEIAVGDDGVAPALDHADQHLGTVGRRQRSERGAVETAALAHAILHDLRAALRKGVDAHGAREAQDTRDLPRALVLGVDDEIDPQRVAQKLGLVQIFRVADAGHDLGRAQLARRDTADHVDLVELGRGDQQLGLGGSGLAQRLGVGGAALDTDDVQLVRETADGLGVALDHGQIVPLGLEHLRHGIADLPRPGNDDLHNNPRFTFFFENIVYHAARELYSLECRSNPYQCLIPLTIHRHHFSSIAAISTHAPSGTTRTLSCEPLHVTSRQRTIALSLLHSNALSSRNCRSAKMSVMKFS